MSAAPQPGAPAPTRSRGRRVGVPRARARFITQAIELEEADAPGVVRAWVLFAVLLVAGGIGWSMTTQLNEAARAPGEVVPTGFIHKIQHLEGGIVRNIEIRNGDRVNAGDVLVELASSGTRSELDQLEARHAAITLKLERVEALLGERAPRFKDRIRYPRLVAGQQALYEDQRASHREQIQLLAAQITQREAELEALAGQVAAIEKEMALLEELSSMQAGLAKNRVIARADHINSRVRLISATREFRELQGRIRISRDALAEARQRQIELGSRLRAGLSTEASQLTTELAEVEQAIVRARGRLDRLVVRAPIAGIIKGLGVNTVNAVVQPGQVMMEIVPVGRELMVEARISTADVGHVKTGQSVDVKVTSYESTRFGTVPGVLKQISASTYLGPDGVPYYLAEVALAHDYLGNDPNQNRIIPGMTVQADILTGRRTVMDYMLKPVYRGFQTAFRER